MTSSAMVKALVSTTPHPLASEMAPPTLFDRATFDLLGPLLFVYPAPSPSNEALKEGLSRVVVAYPHLAGCLAVDQRGRRSIHVNNEGMLVIDDAMAVDLASVVLVDAGVVADLGALYPRLLTPEVRLHPSGRRSEPDQADPVQLRRPCGGPRLPPQDHERHRPRWLLGNLVSWSRAVRQGTDFTAPSLFLDCGILTAMDPTTPVFDHGSIEFKGPSDALVPTCNRKTIKLSFTSEFMAELKARVGAPCTTFQCVLVHMWKKTTQARGVKPEEFTQVRVAVNCRSRATPPVRSDLFGNMVLWAFPRLQARDILCSGYGRVVCAIREAVDGGYIRSFLNFGAMAEAQAKELTATAPAAGTMCCPNLEVDSWLRFGYHNVDFGGGPPSPFLFPDIPAEGIMVL
ncbi:hypothetical protein ACQ4PT_040761 [Festuca glaucescens]